MHPPDSTPARLTAEQLDEVFDTLDECLLGLDADGRCRYSSAALQRLLRRDAGSLEGQPVARVLRRKATRDLPNWDEALAALARGAQFDSELETFEREDGMSFSAAVRARALGAEGPLRVLVRVRDLTEINRQSKAFHASVRSFRALFDGANDAIFFLGRSGKVLDANQGAERMFGHAPAAFIGKHLHGLAAGDGLAGLDAALETMFTQGQGQRIEYLSKGRARTRFAAEMYVYPANYFGQDAAMAVIHDVSARKAYETRLIEARAAAEEANRMKSQFLGNMSHELRTPMNGIIGMGELLRETELDEEQRDYLDTLLDSARNLNGILDDVLGFAALEAGRFHSQPVEFCPLMLLEDMQRRFAGRCAEKGLSLEVGIGAAGNESLADAVIGDMEAVSNVLRRLLDNAVKFTRAGVVELIVGTPRRADGGLDLCCTVRDTGVGIEPDMQARVFEAFTQADGSVTREHGGTGMGLTVARATAAALGGSLTLESRPGEGSAFTLCVPVREAP